MFVVNWCDLKEICMLFLVSLEVKGKSGNKI